MKIRIPSLDRGRFQDLWELALTELPGLTREWTNYNPADPGVVTLEVLLFLLDILYWRLDFLDEEEIKAYRRLLGIPADESLSSWWRKYLSCGAAVTPGDLERILLESGPFERVYLYPDLRAREVRVTVISSSPIVPEKLRQLEREIQELGLRPLTLEIRLEPPRKTLFSLETRLYPLPGYPGEELRQKLTTALSRYLSPLEGLNGRGYPPGRPLYLSEIYACLEQTPGVDGIADLSVRVYPPGRFDGEKILPGEERFPELLGISLHLEEKEVLPCP
ncbi:MAG TPA: hypothetical protein ENJ40_00335 [Thermosulfurimonas dismutans]|uniref:Baseplate protein J-like domain-containing protein n=1 Tax=Thermosulfurimonas dismutans TaxID=999894 RepID=A0A7C3CIY8_9BACT|nr:hypothetical protein [Thermosulfurimonas dismutans]